MSIFSFVRFRCTKIETGNPTLMGLPVSMRYKNKFFVI